MKRTTPARLVRRVSDGQYLRKGLYNSHVWVVSQGLASPFETRLEALAYAVDRGITEAEVRVVRVGPK